jgi:beta-1,4-N-acetylglucosaminyltransferase
LYNCMFIMIVIFILSGLTILIVTLLLLVQYLDR